MSIDANFGLCRKKSAGTSVHEPLSGTTMFYNQNDVNQFISNYGSTNLGPSSVSVTELYRDAKKMVRVIFYSLLIVTLTTVKNDQKN